MSAKTATPKNDKGLAPPLWDFTNKLRGSVEASGYKHVVLRLIFLKFISAKFEDPQATLRDEDKEEYLEQLEFYVMENVFYPPQIKTTQHQDKIALAADRVRDYGYQEGEQD